MSSGTALQATARLVRKRSMSAALKPSSAKVLINALVNIKAQPGWLIVIVGHSDTTGDAVEICAPVHPKKSQQSTQGGDVWRNFLLRHLFGGKGSVAQIR